MGCHFARLDANFECVWCCCLPTFTEKPIYSPLFYLKKLQKRQHSSLEHFWGSDGGEQFECKTVGTFFVNLDEAWD